MSALAVSIFRARLVTTEFVAYVCGRHLDKFLQQLHLIFYGLCTDQCLEHALPIALRIYYDHHPQKGLFDEPNYSKMIIKRN